MWWKNLFSSKLKNPFSEVISNDLSLGALGNKSLISVNGKRFVKLCKLQQTYQCELHCAALYELVNLIKSTNLFGFWCYDIKQH